MAKIEAGRISLGNSIIDLPALVAHVVEQFIPKDTARKLQLIHKPGEAVARYMTGDEEKIGHIVANMIDNALKFSKEGVFTYSAAPASVTDSID